MAACGVGDLCAGEHAGDLFDAGGAVEAAGGDLCATADAALVDQEVRVGEARDLRLVRDAEDLVGARERLELEASRATDDISIRPNAIRTSAENLT